MARDRAERPEAKPLRLFAAVDVPDDVKARLASDVARFRDRIPGARWTRSDGWHVTLKFLGATWPRLVDEVRESVATAAREAEPFESSLTELGVFPSPRRARVVWAGLADPGERFGALAKRLDDLLEADFIPESRRFTPHLTLARLVPPRDISEFAPELVGTTVASASFTVDRLVLYRSHLSPKGATYEPMLRCPLGDG
jgi:RNA 2',3'-cyclic 3'-phosphodiesterase